MARESNKFLLCSGGDGVPIGTFTWWFGLETQIPEGWLKLDGSEFSVTDYPKLYSVLGTNVLPDMVGKFIKGGDAGQIEEEAGLPNILGDAAYIAIDKTQFEPTATSALQISATGAHEFGTDPEAPYSFGHVLLNASLSNPIYGNSTTVTPNNISAIPIIKAGTKGTNLIYTNEEIDTFFDTLEQRVAALETGTALADNNEEAHEISPDAHETLFSEKASTTSTTDLQTGVDTLESNVANLESLIEQKESEMEG